VNFKSPKKSFGEGGRKQEKSEKIKQHCIILKLEKCKKAGANKLKRLATRIKGYSK